MAISYLVFDIMVKLIIMYLQYTIFRMTRSSSRGVAGSTIQKSPLPTKTVLVWVAGGSVGVLSGSTPNVSEILISTFEGSDGVSDAMCFF